MKKSIYIFVAILALTIALVGAIYYQVSNIPLSSQMEQSKNVMWFDDYFIIEYIDETTIAIGEPRYYQKNYNYLIIGKNSAILFDTGSGTRNIKPVVSSLTKLPITVISSHLHYDHIGSHVQFESIAMIDIEETRQRLKSKWFSPTYFEHIGFMEGVEKPSFKVTEKLQPNQVIDLGERALKVLHTPGHTQESIMLYDEGRNLLFSGDFIYEGELFVFLPGSDIDEYHKSTQELLASTTNDTRLLAAHSGTTPSSLPILDHKNLVDLDEALSSIIKENLDAEGFILKTYKVNDRIGLITN